MDCGMSAHLELVGLRVFRELPKDVLLQPPKGRSKENMCKSHASLTS